VRVVGNPIRGAFAKVLRLRQQFARTNELNPLNRAATVGQLVVLSGAAGNGGALNDYIPKALYKLSDALAGWRILHQTGSRDLAATKRLYQKLGVTADVVSFIPDMPRVLLGADIVIARPGGITLSELAAAAVPVIAVPSNAERQQIANAMVFEQSGACRVVEEASDTLRLDDRIVAALRELLLDSDLRASMSAAIGQLARPDAAWQVASTVLDLAHSARLQNVA
jgi:UDP-N-acetylglucosamine--N-acetylmuramyl-(pentapeptide) pyrophosphoryl-undecaprenol N-acetylglucosamine transferase